jgi:hypothetical protein
MLDIVPLPFADFASLLINKQKNKKRGNTDSQ